MNMLSVLKHILISWVLIGGTSSTLFAQPDYLIEEAFATPFSPSQRPRMVAEWEPAKGVLVAWPLGIPYKLLIQLAKDTRLYITVNSRESMQSAIKAFTSWGILPTQVRFVQVPQGLDYFWTRDWGPPGVFSHEGEFKMVDSKYGLSTPLTGLSCNDTLNFLFKDSLGNPIHLIEEENAPIALASDLGWEVIKMPIAFTGGNVLMDGQRTAYSTCAIISENEYLKQPIQNVRNEVLRALGIEHYQIISNFEESGIQHIDCLMKLLDEETMLVLRVPEDHPSYSQIEGIVEYELKTLKNAFGKPYVIKRIDTHYYRDTEVGAYTNSLVLNKKVYVPLYGIPQDEIALKQWQEYMPGYEIMGFEFNVKKEPNPNELIKKHYVDFGWVDGDALHCRTRGIWDDKMIYISVDKIPAVASRKKEYVIDAIVKDYSGTGLNSESVKLKWRMAGDTNWKSQTMKAGPITDHYSGLISGNMSGVGIEYYIEATNNDQATYFRPITAPETPYSFQIE